MLLFGWALALLTPMIAEHNRRRYRRRDLTRAVVDELVSLQFTMAMVAWSHRARNAQVTDIFLDAIIPLIQSYAGPDKDEGLVSALQNSRARSEEERIAAHRVVRKPNEGLIICQYALPLFVTQIADLAICPLPFQRSVSHIRYHLDLFNQRVPYLLSLFDKTYTVTDQNREIMVGNLEAGYRFMGERAEIIVKAIEELKGAV